MTEFITLQTTRAITIRVFNKDQRIRLRSDSPAGQAYLHAKATGGKSIEVNGISIPLGSVEEVYRGPDRAAATVPGPGDL